MKKFVILIVCFLITSLAVAQEKSWDLIILGEKVYKCRQKANPKPKDFADIEKRFLKIVNKNKSEAPLACMYMGELYRTMSNKLLNDGQKSLVTIGKPYDWDKRFLIFLLSLSPFIASVCSTKTT